MYYSFTEIYENELVNILWNIGIKNYDIIFKIININKKEKLNNIRLIENEARKHHIDIDCAGEYNINTKLEENTTDWDNYVCWNNIHRELLIWYKYFYKNTDEMFTTNYKIKT